MVHAETNTQEIIQPICENDKEDKEIQTDSPSEDKQLATSEEVYAKLAVMLHEMGINSKDILPNHQPPKLQEKQYKKLSDGEIIKVQKFLIKKLA